MKPFKDILAAIVLLLPPAMACVPQTDPAPVPALREAARVQVGSGFPVIMACDIFDDGVDELVVADEYAGEYPRNESGEIRVLAGPIASGSWTGVPVWMVARGQEPFRRYGGGLAAADLNADGIKDLVLRADHAVDNVGILRVLSGTLTGEVMIESSAFLTVTGPATLGQAMIGMDYNSDGVDDLVVSCPLRSEVYVVLGPRSGELRLPEDADAVLFTESGSLGWSVCSADFNGNGWPDLAIAQTVGNVIYLLPSGLLGRHAADMAAWAVIRSSEQGDDLTGHHLLQSNASAGLFIRSRRTDLEDTGTLFIVPGPLGGGQIDLRGQASQALEYSAPVLGASAAWLSAADGRPILAVGTSGMSHIPDSNLKGGLWLLGPDAVGELGLQPAAIQPHGRHVSPQELDLDWLGRSVLSARLESPAQENLVVSGRGTILVMSFD